MALFVLVHSPSVGPATWAPVAERLSGRGHGVVVPSLLGVGDGGPPYWPRVSSAVAAGLAGTDSREPLVLVVHSNAGVFVPVIIGGLRRPVARVIFADATVPASHGHTPVAGAGVLDFLRGLAGPDGRLPPWTEWWDEADVAPMFPGPDAREAVTGELPRLPLTYYHERVPAPAGWDRRPCGYLLFSEGYEGEAEEARRRGWPVRTLPGEHLHQIVDPAGVASALLDLAGTDVSS